MGETDEIMSQTLLVVAPGWRGALVKLRPNLVEISRTDGFSTVQAEKQLLAEQLEQNLSRQNRWMRNGVLHSRGIETSSLLATRGFASSSIKFGDDKEKKSLEKKKKADAKVEKKAKEAKVAGEATAEEAAAEKAAIEKAAKEKAAAEEAAAEEAAAEKAATEKAAAEKAAAEKAAAEKAAEEIAIRNMKDPIQELFLTAIRAYS